MQPSHNQPFLSAKAKNNLWIGVFFLVMLGISLTLYFSALTIDYTWRWYRVPQYFFYQEPVELKSDINGVVASVVRKGEEVIIQVTGEGESEQYRGMAEEILVGEGDFIFPGDTLARYHQWRIGVLTEGLWITLKVSLFAILAGIVIGLVAGLARISSNPAFKWSAITYIELIRGSPLLVQIFIWYFVLGTLINTILEKKGILSISPFWYGVAALSCFAGAYIAEIVRAGIQSIHRGQMEASRSLGMSYTQAMRYVVLPQAFRRIIPPLAGQFISLIKDSSLLGIIATRELTKATRELVSSSLQPFELWFLCALLYLLLTFSLSMLLQYMEKKMVMT